MLVQEYVGEVDIDYVLLVIERIVIVGGGWFVDVGVVDCYVQVVEFFDCVLYCCFYCCVVGDVQCDVNGLCVGVV